MRRFGVLVVTGLLTIVLGSSVASAQAVSGKVLDIQGKVLDIVGLGANSQGTASSISGQVASLGAAINNLKATSPGVVVTETPKLSTPQAPTHKEIKIYLPADVLFDFDKADLRPEAGPVLERVAAVLRSDPIASATIDGHTDGKGGEQYNQILSMRRAESVQSWLVAHAVANKMVARGFGKTRPVAPNTLPNGADNPEGRQKNRRVEITFSTEH